MPSAPLPGVTLTQASSLLLAIAATDQANSTINPPTGMTTRFSDADASSPTLMAFEANVGAGATGIKQATMSGSIGSSNAGILLGLKPSP